MSQNIVNLYIMPQKLQYSIYYYLVVIFLKLSDIAACFENLIKKNSYKTFQKEETKCIA